MATDFSNPMNAEISPALSHALAVCTTIAGGIAGIWSQHQQYKADCKVSCFPTVDISIDTRLQIGLRELIRKPIGTSSQ